MRVYLDLVVLLNFCVDFLLLLGTNKLSGYPLSVFRSALAAVVGSIYAMLCLLSGFAFLSSAVWRIFFLCLMAVVAFGWNFGTVRRAILFAFLSTALGGASLWIGKGGFWDLLFAAGGITVMCILGFRGKVGSCDYVPVELHQNKRCIRMIALRDTGNTLRDPITGQQVLVAGPELAMDAFGLTKAQLLNPVRTMEEKYLPGLRLIPYRSVGSESGMLLAVRFDEVRINGEKSESLVAFSPNSFGKGAEYQALTGG